MGVTVERCGDFEPIGLDMETFGSVAMITRISDGPIRRYNDMVTIDQEVAPWDFVVDISGIDEDNKLTVTLRRPIGFMVSVDKSAFGSLGLDLDFHDNGASLVIMEVEPGPIEEWNKKNPDREVKVDDRIIAINGARGTAEELLEICKQNSKLDMVIIRPSPAGLPAPAAVAAEAAEAAAVDKPAAETENAVKDAIDAPEPTAEAKEDVVMDAVDAPQPTADAKEDVVMEAVSEAKPAADPNGKAGEENGKVADENEKPVDANGTATEKTDVVMSDVNTSEQPVANSGDAAPEKEVASTVA